MVSGRNESVSREEWLCCARGAHLLGSNGSDAPAVSHPNYRVEYLHSYIAPVRHHLYDA